MIARPQDGIGSSGNPAGCSGEARYAAPARLAAQIRSAL